jgi:hypothetical protein
MCVDHRCEQIVGRGDRMQIAGEVEVEVLHRHDLRVAPAGGTALDAEDRAERGLTQAQHRLSAESPETLRQGDRRGRLPFASRGGRDGRDVDELCVRPVREPLDDREIDLRLEAAVRLDLLRKQTRLGGHVQDRTQHRALCDLEA